MKSDDLLEVCDGTLVKPEEGTQDYQVTLVRWTNANKAAKKLIATTLESKPLQLIMNCDTARDMWQKLHSVFDMKSEESLSLIQKEFFEFRWDPAGNVAQHISKLEQMASKLKALGGEIPPSMLITRILSTLPPKFNHFHSAWDSTTEAKRTVENLTARLMTEELRMLKRNETEESTVALMSKMNLKNIIILRRNKQTMWKEKIVSKERKSMAASLVVRRTIYAKTVKAVMNAAQRIISPRIAQKRERVRRMKKHQAN